MSERKDVASAPGGTHAAPSADNTADRVDGHEAVAAAGAPSDADQGGARKAPPPVVESLTAYYRADLPPAALARGVAKNLHSFPRSEQQQALEAIDETDPRLQKTFGLATAPLAPPAFWGWAKLVTARLDRAVLKTSEDVTEMPGERRFAEVTAALAPALNGEDKGARQRAEHHLLLSLRALLERQVLEPLAALAILRSRLAIPPEGRLSRVRHEIASARLTQIKRLSDVAGLSEVVVGTARQERDDARLQAAHLRDRLREAQALRDAAEARVVALQGERDELREGLKRQRRAAQEVVQTGALESADTRGRAANFLEDALAPLLREAADAIAEEPVALPFARKRLEMALKRIEGEIAWLRPSSG